MRGNHPIPRALALRRTTDLTAYLNERSSVYLRFTGKVKVYHVKVDYGE